MLNQLIYPMVGHVAWTASLYVLLTVLRAPTIWKIGSRNDGSNPWANIEPKVSANLSNQFEWPIFFYVVCLLLLLDESLFNTNYLWLAWLFVLGRVVHSLVQILTSNIRLRGIVFTINFIAVLGMWTLYIVNS